MNSSLQIRAESRVKLQLQLTSLPYVDKQWWIVVASRSLCMKNLKEKLNYFANSSESKATICLTHGFDSPALSGALKQLQTLTHQIS